MRIGQILIEADLISPKQLSNGLEYGKAKHIALGRVLKLLKVLQESDIEKTLEAQKLIRMGLSPVIGVEALKQSVKSGCSLQKAIQDRHKDALNNLDKDAVAAPQSNDFVDVDYAASAEKLIEKGDKLLLEDNCAQAEKHYLAAKAVMEKTLGRNHIDLASVFSRLGNAYMATDRFEKAEECYEEVLILKMKAFASSHPQIAQAYESLADLYKASGQEEQARENYLMALDILEKGLPSSLSLYSSILRRIAASAQLTAAKDARPQPIGELLKTAGLISEEKLNSALRIAKQTRAPLGVVLREQNMVNAIDLQSSLKSQMYIRQGVLTEELAVDLMARASRRGISLERLLHEAGILAQDNARFELYREIAVELDRLVAAETGGTEQAEMAPIAYNLAGLYEQVGDRPQAEIYYQRALKIWGAETRGDILAAKACSALAKILVAQDRKMEAIPLLHKALEHRQQALGTNHDETLDTLEDIAELEIDQQNAAGAFMFLRSAFGSRTELGQEESKLMRPVLLLGDCAILMGNLEEAETQYLKALELAQSGFGSASLPLVAVAEKLGDLYVELSRFNDASRQYNYGLLILKRAGKLDSDSANRLHVKVSNTKAKT